MCSYSYSVLEVLSEFPYLNWLCLKGNFEIPCCSINVLIYPLSFRLVPLGWLLRIACLAALGNRVAVAFELVRTVTPSVKRHSIMMEGQRVPLGTEVKTWFLIRFISVWMIFLISILFYKQFPNFPCAQYLFSELLVRREIKLSKDSNPGDIMWHNQFDIIGMCLILWEGICNYHSGVLTSSIWNCSQQSPFCWLPLQIFIFRFASLVPWSLRMAKTLV